MLPEVREGKYPPGSDKRYSTLVEVRLCLVVDLAILNISVTSAYWKLRATSWVDPKVIGLWKSAKTGTWLVKDDRLAAKTFSTSNFWVHNKRYRHNVYPGMHLFEECTSQVSPLLMVASGKERPTGEISISKMFLPRTYSDSLKHPWWRHGYRTRVIRESSWGYYLYRWGTYTAMRTPLKVRLLGTCASAAICTCRL